MDEYYLKLYNVLKTYNLTNPNVISHNISKMTDVDLKQFNKDWKSVYKTLNYNAIHDKFDEKKYLRYFPTSSFQSDLNQNIVNRFLLYADKLVVYEPLTQLSLMTYSADACRDCLLEHLPKFLAYQPIFKHNIGELVPNLSIIRHYNSTSLLGHMIKEDSSETGFRQICEKAIKIGYTDQNQLASYFDGELSLHLPPMSIPIGKGTTTSIPIPTTIGKTIKIKKEQDVVQKEKINALIERKAMEINFDLQFVHKSSAYLVSNSEITFELLKNKSERVNHLLKNVDMKFLPALLNLELNTFNSKSPGRIIKLRNKYDSEFENLRAEIRKSFQQLESIPYSESFTSEVRTVQEDIINPAIRNLNKEIHIMNKDIICRILGKATITSLPLVGSFMIHDFFKYAIISGIISSGFTFQELWDRYNDYVKEKDMKRTNSWYFLWRASNDR